MGIILTDLVARTLQRASPGQAATAIDGTVRGVFVSRYHSCQSSYLMDVTSGEGHTPGQTIVLVVIYASVSIYQWVVFMFNLNMVSAGTILNDQLRREKKL